MPKIIFNEEMERELIVRYQTETAKELAKRFHCAVSTIKNKMSAFNQKKSKVEKLRTHIEYLRRGVALKRNEGKPMKDWLNSFALGETRVLTIDNRAQKNYLSVSVCRWNIDYGRPRGIILKIVYHNRDKYAEVTAFNIKGLWLR